LADKAGLIAIAKKCQNHTMSLILSNRRSNPARLKNVKFPVFIVSPLEIRQYIGVTKLQKRKIFLFLRSKSFCHSFFCAGKREIGHQANAYD